jgi:hypothetical protein
MKLYIVIVEGNWANSRAFTTRQAAESYLKLVEFESAGIIETTLDNNIPN